MSNTLAGYKAYFDYRRNDNHIQHMDITYTALNPSDAVRDALRFYRLREESLPDHFGEILCLKVAFYVIGPIAEDGSLTNPGNWHFFEYKYDTAGLPLAEYVEYRCSEFDRRLRK